MHRLSPIEVQIPASNEQEDQVTPNERDQNAQVPPSRRKADAQRLVELVANTVGAVLTIRRRVVGDVPSTACCEECLHVLAAGLAWRCGERIELAGRTDNGKLMQLR